MDNISKEERSRVMASVRQRDTKPEKKVRSFLHKRGLRYRLHVADLPGRPDVVFPRYETVLFVHGCYWHGHPDPLCKLARIPKSNVEFWENKIATNQERDKRNIRCLLELGWRVLVVWECQISDQNILEGICCKIRNEHRHVNRGQFKLSRN